MRRNLELEDHKLKVDTNRSNDTRTEMKENTNESLHDIFEPGKNNTKIDQKADEYSVQVIVSYC